MTDRPDFGSYLRQAMEATGYPTVRSLSRASGIAEAVIARWLTNESWPTIEGLRPLAPAIRVPLLELLVAAGRLTAVEARLEADPAPPEPQRSIEEMIRLEPGMTPERANVLIGVYRELSAENKDAKSGRRKRREA